MSGPDVLPLLCAIARHQPIPDTLVDRVAAAVFAGLVEFRSSVGMFELTPKGKEQHELAHAAGLPALLAPLSTCAHIEENAARAGEVFSRMLVQLPPGCGMVLGLFMPHPGGEAAHSTHVAIVLGPGVTAEQAIEDIRGTLSRANKVEEVQPAAPVAPAPPSPN